jgi:hypothetical protein
MFARCFVCAGVVLSLCGPVFAALIDNGIVGDGRWEVDVLAGGESRTGNLNPVGAIGNTDVLFDYFHYVQVGNGNGTRLSATNVTQAPTLSGANQMTSQGSFNGENGLVNWTAVSSIAPGSPIYLTQITFSSLQPFGVLRLIQYLDEDVFNVSDDNLIVFGTSGQAGFELLTVDGANAVGVSQSAGFATAQNMTYLGWAADEFADLRTAIQNGTASFSVAGTVDLGDLPAIADPRFPGRPAFGPSDVTSAIAFALDPNAMSGSVSLALGGSPRGGPVITPVIPEPGTFSLMALAAAAALVTRKLRKA